MENGNAWLLARLAAAGGLLVGLTARAGEIDASYVPGGGCLVAMDVDFSNPVANEELYAAGPLSVRIRLAADSPDAENYDRARANYLSFPMPDGSCPVIEATLPAPGGTVGMPVSLVAPTGGVQAVKVRYDGVRLAILVGGRYDVDAPRPGRIGWPSSVAGRVLSPRVSHARLGPAGVAEISPAMPDARDIAGTLQYWTPPAHDAWMGDVALGVWRDRLHLFYLYDRRHHGSGAGTGRHFFAHLSSADLAHWTEHPAAVPINAWWETVGTGTPFEYDGKLCLAYGLHTDRYATEASFVTAHLGELPPGKRGDGNFTFSDLPCAVPFGGTYAESDDGIHFRKTGVFLTADVNPSVHVRADGRLGLVTADGQMHVSRDGRLGHWMPDGEPAPTGGDCPAPFSWGGRDYLLQGFFWMASRGPDGKWEDWATSGDDIYDGLSVPMVAAWKGDRRILAGWLRHVYPEGWGGWLVFRELVRFPDGKLGIRWLPETPPPVAPYVFRVTDLARPFVLRASSEKGEEDVEFRIDPAEDRAQFAFPKKGETGCRVQTTAEILAARSPETRYVRLNKKGDLPFHCGPAAVGKIRGLDRPFEVRFVQYYDAKSMATVFDVEIAGTRTLITRRFGRFAPAREL